MLKRYLATEERRVTAAFYLGMFVMLAWILLAYLQAEGASRDAAADLAAEARTPDPAPVKPGKPADPKPEAPRAGGKPAEARRVPIVRE